MAATDLFAQTKELRDYLPMIQASRPMTEMEFAFRQPEDRMKELLGETTYNLIKTHYEGGPADAVLDKAVKYLQGALANMAGNIIFISESGERNENKKMFKYQEVNQMHVFQDTANAEIGQLLVLLDSDATKFSAWAATTLCTTRKEQLIKTHTEFGKYYYIDESAYFFARVIFLMKEITDDKLIPRIGTISDLHAVDDTAIINQAKKVLAYLTTAMAIRRFDFVELPKTIRNNLVNTDRTVRTGGQEDAAVRRIAEELETKGMIYLQVLDRMQEKKSTGTLAEPEEINDVDNGFYLQT